MHISSVQPNTPSPTHAHRHEKNVTVHKTKSMRTCTCSSVQGLTLFRRSSISKVLHFAAVTIRVLKLHIIIVAVGSLKITSWLFLPLRVTNVCTITWCYSYELTIIFSLVRLGLKYAYGHWLRLVKNIG